MPSTTMPGMTMPGKTISGQGQSGGANGARSIVGPSLVPNGTGAKKVSAPHADGCNHDYGSPGICIPTRAPGGKPVTCEFLDSYHYFPLLVGKDSLGLISHHGALSRLRTGHRYIVGCHA